MLPKIIERNLFSPVNWDVIIDSSKVGCRKPHEQIYRIAQGKVGVQNEEILFIDNLTKNLVVPKKLGWKTFLYDPNNFEQSSIDLGKYFDQIRVL
jgi:FMN phosphatase YigB (HAD superfamily)